MSWPLPGGGIGNGHVRQHHRVVSGQLHNAQTQTNRPLTHAHTTRCVLELDALDGSAGR